MPLARTCALFLSALLAGPLAHASVSLPHMLSDHAVLQREQPIHIWGWADPGEAVTVGFHGQTRSTTTDGMG